MYLTTTRHRVKSYKQWKEAFDVNSPMLVENGIKEWKIVQIHGDPTDVAVICFCPSKKEWDAFVAADQEKFRRTGVDPRIKGGLVGDPEWWAGEVVGSSSALEELLKGVTSKNIHGEIDMSDDVGNEIL